MPDQERECRYQDKIIEMSTDIKWLVKDTKARNHKFETHIQESDRFRTAVTRNTTWRHAFKITMGGIIWGIGRALTWW